MRNSTKMPCKGSEILKHLMLMFWRRIIDGVFLGSQSFG